MTATFQRLTNRAAGIPGLDHVARGGLPARSAALVMGEAGTAKTTLAANFAEAAAGRGGES